MTITHYKNTLEAQVCMAFLMWQGKSASITEDDGSLKDSNGSGKPIVKLRGKTIAIGMNQLWEYWDRNGLWML